MTHKVQSRQLPGWWGAESPEQQRFRDENQEVDFFSRSIDKHRIPEERMKNRTAELPRVVQLLRIFESRGLPLGYHPGE